MWQRGGGDSCAGNTLVKGVPALLCSVVTATAIARAETLPPLPGGPSRNASVVCICTQLFLQLEADKIFHLDTWGVTWTASSSVVSNSRNPAAVSNVMRKDQSCSRYFFCKYMVFSTFLQPRLRRKEMELLYLFLLPLCSYEQSLPSLQK